MEKQTYIYLFIEAIIFLIPVATLFIKLGGYKKMLEDIDFPERLILNAPAVMSMASRKMGPCPATETLCRHRKNGLVFMTA